MKYDWAIFKTTHGWSRVSHLVWGLDPYDPRDYVRKACCIGTGYRREKVTFGEGNKKCDYCKGILAAQIAHKLKE